jgi:sugar phosphate isomerase/epimerase
MKIGVADFGMNVWDGGCFDIQQRLLDIKAIGYDGTERLDAVTDSEAMYRSAMYRRLGMDFALCRGTTIQNTIEWTAALGKCYVWVTVTGKDFETYCRQAQAQAQASLRYGVRTVVHNHLGQTVESQKQVENFLAKCPDCGLLLDTAHLDGAGGNCMEIVEKYSDRIAAIHLKDWVMLDESKGLNEWSKRLRFCELGTGKLGDLNAKVLSTMVRKGFDGWVCVEHDHHQRDPLKDLAISREYIREAGF